MDLGTSSEFASALFPPNPAHKQRMEELQALRSDDEGGDDVAFDANDAFASLDEFTVYRSSRYSGRGPSEMHEFGYKMHADTLVEGDFNIPLDKIGNILAHVPEAALVGIGNTLRDLFNTRKKPKAISNFIRSCAGPYLTEESAQVILNTAFVNKKCGPADCRRLIEMLCDEGAGGRLLAARVIRSAVHGPLRFAPMCCWRGGNSKEEAYYGMASNSKLLEREFSHGPDRPVSLEHLQFWSPAYKCLGGQVLATLLLNCVDLRDGTGIKSVDLTIARDILSSVYCMSPKDTEFIKQQLSERCKKALAKNHKKALAAFLGFARMLMFSTPLEPTQPSLDMKGRATEEYSKWFTHTFSAACEDPAQAASFIRVLTKIVDPETRGSLTIHASFVERLPATDAQKSLISKYQKLGSWMGLEEATVRFHYGGNSELSSVPEVARAIVVFGKTRLLPDHILRAPVSDPQWFARAFVAALVDPMYTVPVPEVTELIADMRRLGLLPKWALDDKQLPAPAQPLADVATTPAQPSTDVAAPTAAVPPSANATAVASSPTQTPTNGASASASLVSASSGPARLVAAGSPSQAAPVFGGLSPGHFDTVKKSLADVTAAHKQCHATPAILMADVEKRMATVLKTAQATVVGWLKTVAKVVKDLKERSEVYSYFIKAVLETCGALPLIPIADDDNDFGYVDVHMKGLAMMLAHKALVPVLIPEFLASVAAFWMLPLEKLVNIAQLMGAYAWASDKLDTADDMDRSGPCSQVLRMLAGMAEHPKLASRVEPLLRVTALAKSAIFYRMAEHSLRGAQGADQFDRVHEDPISIPSVRGRDFYAYCLIRAASFANLKSLWGRDNVRVCQFLKEWTVAVKQHAIALDEHVAGTVVEVEQFDLFAEFPVQTRIDTLVWTISQLSSLVAAPLDLFTVYVLRDAYKTNWPCGASYLCPEGRKVGPQMREGALVCFEAAIKLLSVAGDHDWLDDLVSTIAEDLTEGEHDRVEDAMMLFTLIPPHICGEWRVRVLSICKALPEHQFTMSFVMSLVQVLSGNMRKDHRSEILAAAGESEGLKAAFASVSDYIEQNRTMLANIRDSPLAKVLNVSRYSLSDLPEALIKDSTTSTEPDDNDGANAVTDTAVTANAVTAVVTPLMEKTSHPVVTMTTVEGAVSAGGSSPETMFKRLSPSNNSENKRRRQ